jgi:hypothetical protein
VFDQASSFRTLAVVWIKGTVMTCTSLMILNSFSYLYVFGCLDETLSASVSSPDLLL